MSLESCFNGHAVVCGYGHLGCRTADQLRECGCEVVVIDNNLDDTVRRHVEASGHRFVDGDIREDGVLEEAGISSAGCFIAVTGDDQANLEAAISARMMNPNVHVVLRLYDQNFAGRVEGIFDFHALSASFLASPAFVSAATDDSIATVFNIDGSCLGLYCCPGNSVKHQYQGLSIRKNGTDLGICSGGDNCEGTGECLYAALHKRDRVNVRRRKHKKAKTLKGRMHEAASLLHPSRLAAEVVDIWDHATAITRSILLSLTGIGLFSVFMFSWLGKMNMLDALYFVVTTMTTTGYGDINLQHAPPGLKVYGILMMLSGAALMATIYAIIADYVLTARVEYLLGRREVNLRDHTVVVGLGNVGFRVAHDLDMLGVEVVAVEANHDSDNLNAARLVFPVIVGDASRASILQKAGIERASVLLALTDDSMLNLSIALHAKETNPGIKTIVRTYDLGLADKFSSFGLDEVLSTSAIAAPAFVYTALFDGVKGSFKCGDDTILAARHIVDNNSPFLGKSVEEIGEKLGIAVVLTASAQQTDYTLATPETVIGKGWRVVSLLDRGKAGKTA